MSGHSPVEPAEHGVRDDGNDGRGHAGAGHEHADGHHCEFGRDGEHCAALTRQRCTTVKRRRRSRRPVKPRALEIKRKAKDARARYNHATDTNAPNNTSCESRAPRTCVFVAAKAFVSLSRGVVAPTAADTARLIGIFTQLLFFRFDCHYCDGFSSRPLARVRPKDA